ncbi:MAG TPA: amidohydrolase family protein [Polyangiaceae bacterium]|nr:amidohydrolase family protein [Polyangiaceae bacterium]
MRDGFQIMDADRHVMEPLSMWAEYLPSHLRDETPRMLPFSTDPEPFSARLERLGEFALLPTPPVLGLAGKPVMRNLSEAAHIEVGLAAERRWHLAKAAETPKGHLADMDENGIDAAVLLPTLASYLVFNDELEPEVSRAYARAYNRWLSHFCAAAPLRLFGAALISRHDAQAMTSDLEEAIRSGARAVVVRPNPVKGQTLSAPSYARFWAACEHHSIGVLLHEGCHARLATTGADRFQTHFAQHACSHPLEAMMALLALIEGGILEKHPRLRVGLLESGCGWLPYWLWRLDHVEYARLTGELRARVRMPPSQYFRRQCWIAMEPSEALLAPAIADIGPSRVLFGSDFPHPDHSIAIVDDVLSLRHTLGEAVVRDILWQNPRQLMGIDTDR